MKLIILLLATKNDISNENKNFEEKNESLLGGFLAEGINKAKDTIGDATHYIHDKLEDIKEYVTGSVDEKDDLETHTTAAKDLWSIAEKAEVQK